MKLSDQHQYTILCEDAQMRTFLTSFLKCQGIKAHKIAVVPIPAGAGCGEAHVRTGLPKEVELLHRNKHLRKTLLVCIDADKYSYDERKQMLHKSYSDSFPGSDIDDEMMLIWIPKREIETWIAYLKGENVDEEMEFRHGGQPVSCKKEANLMHGFLQNDEESGDDVLPSLQKAKEEYVRICKKQEEAEK